MVVRRSAIAIAIVSALASLATAASARAQPLVVSAEIDPVTDVRVPRTDAPEIHPAGEGFAVPGIGAFDAAFASVSRPAFLDDCLPDAIGATTCVRVDGAELRRMSLADGTVLDAAPLAHRVAARGGVPMIAAHGDDYLMVLESGQLHLWRSTAPSDTTELVLTSCPLCFIGAVACAPRGCGALISRGWSGGPATLFRVDVGTTPALGSSVSLGPDDAYATLHALDDQWLVARTDGVLESFDDALGSQGSVRVAGQALGCVRDACLAVDAAGGVTRCRSGACTPFGALPASLVGTGTRLVCGTESCGVAARMRFGGLSGRDGASVDLTEAYWWSLTSEVAPRAVVTSGAAMVAYTDTRFDPTLRAAIATLEPGVTRDPVFADFGDPSGGPSAPAWLVPTASGATMLRMDGDATSTPRTWVRISDGGAPVDERVDAFTCLGPLAAGPHGLEMACRRRGTMGARLDRVTDDGRPLGISRALPVDAVLALAPGERHSLVIDSVGHAVVVGEPDGVAGPLIDLSPFHRFGAFAAAGADRFLVVSSDYSEVVASFVDGDGHVTELPSLVTDRLAISSPRAVFDGATFLVVWLETTPDGGTERLVLRRVFADGVLDPEERELARSPTTYGTDRADPPDIASDGAGRSVVAFTRHAWSPDRRVITSDVRAFEIRALAPDGTPCSDASQCGSAVCADGVCCAVPCGGACEVCSIAAGARIDGVCEPTCFDAGPPPDAGARRDAAVVRDASVVRDAAVTRVAPRSGCGCGVDRRPPGLAALALLACVLARRRARTPRLTS